MNTCDKYQLLMFSHDCISFVNFTVAYCLDINVISDVSNIYVGYLYSNSSSTVRSQTILYENFVRMTPTIVHLIPEKSFSSLVSQCCIYVRCACQCQFMWGNFRNLSTHFRSKLTGSSETYLVSLLTICQRYQYDLWDMDLDTLRYMTIILFSERIPVVRRTISKMLTLADANHRTIL